MNPEEEFAILNALDEGSLAANEVDSALRALAGSDADRKKTLELIVARQQSGYNPNQRLSASPSPRDSDFDYETGGDSALRALMSFGETAAEREGILRSIVGESGYTRDSQGQLALTEAGQIARGIEPTGKNIVIEDEGFSLGDFADLTGIVPETVGAIVGGVLGAPGLVTGAAGAAAGAAAGQAIEEGVEKLLGVQQQTASEVASDLATEAALAGGLDFLTMGTFRLAKGIVGGTAGRLTARGEPVSPEMGADLVRRGYRPSLEALGAPTLLAKGVKFAKGATGDVSDVLKNTEIAIAERDAFKTMFGAETAERAGKAFEDVTSDNFIALEKSLQSAQKQSMDAVRSSLNIIRKSLDEGFDINPEALNSITSAFDTFNTNAVGKFQLMDELLAKLDVDAAANGLVREGGRLKAINLSPDSNIKGAINDVIDDVGTVRALDPNVRQVIASVNDLGEAATFGNISAQRKLINDILFSGGKEGEALSTLGRKQLLKIRSAMDTALDADTVVRIRGLAPGQNKQLQRIAKLRKEAIDEYRDGKKRFDELERFGVLRNIADATQNPQLYADKFFTKIVQKNSPERLKATLKATDNPEELRQALARSFTDDALRKTNIDLSDPSKFNGARFYNEIESLGSTGKELFGNRWQEVRQLAKTIAKLSPDNMPAQAVDDILRANADKGIVDAVTELSEASRALDEAKSLSFLRSYNAGSLTPDEAVSKLLSPSTKVADWQKIESFFGRGSQELATIKSSMIEKILMKVDGDVFSSPAAAAELKKTLNLYDEAVLQRVMGKEALDKLNKFADELIYLGDVGKEGAIAQGAVAANVTNSPVNAMQRNLRMKAAAKILSSPSLINFYAGTGTSNAIKNVKGFGNAVASTAEVISKGFAVARQGGIRAADEQTDQEIQRIDARRQAARQRQQAPQAPNPNISSSLSAASPIDQGIGASQYYGIPQQASQPSIRQQAATNPALAEALGIRGATAGLLNR